MRAGTLPDGSRGFDANQTLHAHDAAAAVNLGYAFVVRYVRRKTPHAFDLTTAERDAILGAGLGLMVVQHVASEGWTPTQSLGAEYGATAAAECVGLLVPGVTVWCDIEGVAPGVSPHDVITYCNAWYDAVEAAGLNPGLYVGWHAGLTPDELYYKLSFTAYWSAYNLDADRFPSVRGVQMRQSAAKEPDLIPGFSAQAMDVDAINADEIGDTPTLLLP